MKRIILIAFLFSAVKIVSAQSFQTEDSTSLILLNQEIDNAVVKVNVPALEKFYAEDFIFSHGSGKIEGKTSWIKSLSKGGFLLRQHDSVSVEYHKEVTIIKGKLNVQKQTKDKISRYNLHYVRIYALRDKRWKLISHMTTSEFHEN